MISVQGCNQSLIETLNTQIHTNNTIIALLHMISVQECNQYNHSYRNRLYTIDQLHVRLEEF